MGSLRVIQPWDVPPLYVATASAVTFAEGFHGQESDGVDGFRWMSGRGLMAFQPDPDARYLECWILSEFQDLSQHLDVSTPGAQQSEPYPLIGAWTFMSFPVPGGAHALELRAGKIFPREYYPGDHRTLSIRLRDARLHKDPERHARIAAQYLNARLNIEETLAGRTELHSTPSKLGIDLHGACNVKPPCVYCEWDFSKDIEGDHVDTPFTRETLREWGPFFDNSASLVNCSIGEPFMMKNLDELLDVFGKTGKTLEMASNGQILTDRNIQKLLGCAIDLYVSLDAATPLTYARLRNDTFEKILGNLRRLIAAKGGKGPFPRVHLVFMPMRCNVHELDAFVRLCADLNVDRLALRPLNYSDSVALDWDRAGYHFVYKDELLPFEELVRASGRAAQLCRRLGVDLDDQMDFGGSMRALFPGEFTRGEREADVALDVKPSVETAQGIATPTAPPEPAVAPAPRLTGALGGPVEHVERIDSVAPIAPVPSAPLPSLGGDGRPACLEPWKSLYILRRGVLPCCYGGEPIAPVEDYRAAWNSPLMQGIRGELLHGRFHDYCLRSPACPIVRKQERAELLPLGQRLLMRGRHVWARFNRETDERPNRYFYLPLKRTVIRAKRAVTVPGYIRMHSRRLLARLRDRHPN